MKSLFTKTAWAVGFSAGLMLSSCEDKESFAPMNETLPTDAGARLHANSAADSSTLIKHGDELLSYYADGRLKEVVYSNSKMDYGLNSLRVAYTYGYFSDWSQWVLATRYENDFKTREMTWRVKDGKATDLETAHYKLGSGGSPYLYTSATFEYNGKQQLVKVVNSTPDIATISFSYDGNGNLFKHLTTKGSGKSIKVENYNEYAYTDYVGGSLDIDHNRVINTHVFAPNGLHQIGDPYLPIFGKFGKNLVKIKKTSGPTFKFAHTLDAKGTVKAQKITYWDGELVKNKTFIYK